MLAHIAIIAIYRSPRIPAALLCSTLRNIMITLPTVHNIFIGDFNLNGLNKHERTPLYNLFVHELHYKQLVGCFTTDNRTCIDHIYTNLTESNVKAHVLETYFSDHKVVCVLVNMFN